jgi:hypothetical protein
MAKYRVIPIAMTVKNNGIAEHGDIVDESQLCSPAYELIKEGFIEQVQDEEKEESEEKPASKKAKK